MDLTLGDLLDHQGLGLRLVTGGDTTRQRPVRGAHPIEIAAPTRWVPRDWVMLTNGLRLRGRPDEQRALVADLDHSGQAALGWAVGTVMQRVPRALVDEANRRDFPVFLVPLETAFHQIVSFLTQARTHDDVYVMQRVSAMEDYLMDALGSAQPEQTAVRRLASLLGGEVLLTTAEGEPLEASGATPSAELREAVAAGDTVALGTLLGGSPQLATVRSRGAPDRLIVAAAANEQLARVVKPLLLRAAQLLELLGARDTTNARASRRQMADLLGRVLTHPPGQDAAAYDAEAATLGVHVDKGAHAVVWRATADGRRAPIETVRGVLAAADLPHLVANRAGMPVGLVQATEAALTAAFERHRDAAADLVLGVGAPMHSLGELATSLTGAHLALLCHDGSGQVTRYLDLDPMTRLLVTAATAGELDQVRAQLDPIREKPQLMETLVCWLATGGESTAAADRLHLHRNSLRYRLSRIEELTGTSLKSPQSVANLRLALLADELHARITAVRTG